jgi:hypothetical protein
MRSASMLTFTLVQYPMLAGHPLVMALYKLSQALFIASCMAKVRRGKFS